MYCSLGHPVKEVAHACRVSAPKTPGVADIFRHAGVNTVRVIASTPPRLVRQVAEAARHGHYHERPGLGHVSLNRHAPRTVNTLLASLIAEHD